MIKEITSFEITCLSRQRIVFPLYDDKGKSLFCHKNKSGEERKSRRKGRRKTQMKTRKRSKGTREKIR